MAVEIIATILTIITIAAAVPPLLREPKGPQTAGSAQFRTRQIRLRRRDGHPHVLRQRLPLQTLRSGLHDPAGLGVNAEDDGFLQFARHAWCDGDQFLGFEFIRDVQDSSVGRWRTEPSARWRRDDHWRERKALRATNWGQRPSGSRSNLRRHLGRAASFSEQSAKWVEFIGQSSNSFTSLKTIPAPLPTVGNGSPITLRLFSPVKCAM
jgi:hypothetical protein